MSETIFFYVYVDAVSSGMVADMGAERWQTLCVLASFMDESGVCYPSQDYIAARLGVSRQAANKRIKRLLAYRWEGEEVVTAEKRQHGNNWQNTVYTIQPVSRLRKVVLV